jgi:hypothetical protein
MIEKTTTFENHHRNAVEVAGVATMDRVDLGSCYKTPHISEPPVLLWRGRRAVQSQRVTRRALPRPSVNRTFTSGD